MIPGLNVGFFDVSPLYSSFENLPEDQYTPGGFRFRRLGNFELDHTTELGFKQVSSSIMQPADVNSYLGDMERVYSPIEDTTIAHPKFKEMVQKFQEITGWNYEFSLHQIRIKAAPDLTGEPAPEGIHRDGYRWIVPFFANMTNIKGGHGQVFCKEGKKQLLNIAAMPNCYMAFPDREVTHFGAPIKQKDEAIGPGFWDTFVFAADIDK